MPPEYSAPGVYVEEMSSGVRTITGVPTSITAFVHGNGVRVLDLFGGQGLGPLDRALMGSSTLRRAATAGDSVRVMRWWRSVCPDGAAGESVSALYRNCQNTRHDLRTALRFVSHR